jgi:cytochrome c peroxidase
MPRPRGRSTSPFEGLRENDRRRSTLPRPWHPELAQPVDQSAPRNAERFSGACLVAAALLECVRDALPLDTLQFAASARQDVFAAAVRGSLLFVGKAKCTLCHSGPTLTDNEFHNLGGLGTDDGRFTDAGALKASALNIDGAFSDKKDTGRLASLSNPMTDLATHLAFRTPSLREVNDTAPYMHAGQLQTLEAVVSFYNAGGGELPASSPAGTTKDPLLSPLSLSATEQADLVAFLKTLSGDPVPSSLLSPL